MLNAGLNTKYCRPSVEKPLFLYRGDMDQNGRFDLVEAKPAGAGELPVRGRSCSSQAMPFIKEKFKSYKAFASSSLEEIYAPETFSGALKVSAATLESGVLYNESTPGKPRFSFRALPPEARLSPGYGTVAGTSMATAGATSSLREIITPANPNPGYGVAAQALSWPVGKRVSRRWIRPLQASSCRAMEKASPS